MPPESGIDPEFTPHVAVQQTGPVAAETENPLTQLRRVFDAAGLLANAAVTTLNQRAALQRLKEQSVRNQEARMREAMAEGARAARSLQARRLQDVQDQQLSLLTEGIDHDAEWLFRQTRLRFNNAASVEEQRVWAKMLVDTRGLADRFASSEEQKRKNEIIQQFSLARLTARNATVEMGSDLQNDQDLQRDLIGNGVGIHSRVQDWILSEAMRSAPDVFTIDDDDPDAAFKNLQREGLVASLVSESIRIGDRLVDQHGKEIEAASTQAGVDLVGASFVAYFEGEIPIEDLTDSINDVGSLHFNHLTDTQRTQKFKALVADGIEAAAGGQFGQNVSDQLERIDDVIGAAPFNEFERASLRQRARGDLSALAKDRYLALVAEARLSETIEVPIVGENGQILRRSVPNPNADGVMARVDSTTGRTQYDVLADLAIIDAGVDKDPAEMTVFELGVAESIREQARDLNRQGGQRIVKAIMARDNFIAVLSGDPSGNADSAYSIGIARRAFTNDQYLSPSQVRAVQDIDQGIRAANKESGLQGRVTEPESRQVWDGASRLERVPETRSLRESIWTIEAEMWNKGVVQSAHALPNNLTSEMNTLWTQGGPEEMLDVVYFTGNLNQLRRDEMFQAIGHGTPAAVSLRNALHNQLLAANNIEFKMTSEDLVAKAREMMSAVPAGGREGFLNAPTAFPEHIGNLNQDVAAAAFAEILGAQNLSLFDTISNALVGGFGGGASEDYRENVGNISAAFMGPSKPIVDRLFEQWSFRVQTTNDSPSEAANWVFEQMKAEGMRFTNIDGEATLVRDPIGHFGPDSPRADDINDTIAQYIETPLEPWQRIVIAEALGITQPFDIPITMSDMYRAVPDIVNPDFFQDSRGQPVALRFVISDGTNNDAQAILRKTPFDFGGVIIQAVTPDGRIAPVIRARHEVEYTDPDGELHILRVGEPLTVFSSFLLNQRQDQDEIVSDPNRAMDFGSTRFIP